MVNYYDILKVSQKATGTEIKSAYRRLARKLHPDRNTGSQDTALKFAAIAEAYAVLGDAKERIKYDRRLIDAKYLNNGDDDSLFTSGNPHARRWRRMAYNKRYASIINRMAAEQRKEEMAFQKAVFPAAALFLSSLLVTIFKPAIFARTVIIGRIIIVAIFIVAVIHLIRRVRDAFDRYTETDDNIHDSILDGTERVSKPYSRLVASAALIGGLLLCLAVGYFAGTQINFAADALPEMFDRELSLEFIFYPPIITLFVDLVHSFASGFFRSRR